ncbi:MAG: FAD-dependent oxidoreductase [Bacillota bacterium]|nr:FAD-dependent oxidoreductase [Bacillota bacterium]
MTRVDVAVVGGGPAGLNAALAAADAGASVLLIDRQPRLGGQLVKQTHRFFGSRAQFAGTRGFEIGRLLAKRAEAHPDIAIWLDATVIGCYSDSVLMVDTGSGLAKVHADRLVMATGAAERPLAFVNNDLPGIYGAGAVQTLMNLHGVLPGRRAVMVGAGNIGLIISYQLLQAGVRVAAILEAAPAVGGYLVHAAKVARAGIPILTSHTVLAAQGDDAVAGVRVARLSPDWQPVPGSEFEIACDLVCLAVGLSPLVELAALAGCELLHIAELGGFVPWRDSDMQTSVPGVYVAGDAAGVEEASSAMVSGRLAGLAAANSLRAAGDFAGQRQECQRQLAGLRAGPAGEKMRRGLAKMGLAAAGGDGIA